MKYPSIHRRLRLLGAWGSGPLVVAIALLLVSLENGWLWGILFGLSWLMNIVICIGSIFWAIQRGDRMASLTESARGMRESDEKITG